MNSNVCFYMKQNLEVNFIVEERTVMDFDSLYSEYYSMVYSFLLSLSRKPEVAEELTQETFYRAIFNIESFRGSSKISVWLCQIAKNLYFDCVKKKKRETSLNDEIIIGNEMEELVEQLSDKKRFMEIINYLHETEEPYKEVFWMHVFAELTLREISKIFGKSDSWARVTFYRAKKILVDKLKAENTEND